MNDTFKRVIGILINVDVSTVYFDEVSQLSSSKYLLKYGREGTRRTSRQCGTERFNGVSQLMPHYAKRREELSVKNSTLDLLVYLFE